MITIDLILILVLFTLTQSLISPLCDPEYNAQLDSTVRLDSETLYWFSAQLVNVVKTVPSGKAVIQMVSKVTDFWNYSQPYHKIEPPIDAAFTYGDASGAISLVLINLHSPNTKYWVINTETNQIVMSGHNQWNQNIDEVDNIIDIFNLGNTNGYVISESNDKKDLIARKFVWSLDTNKLKQLEPDYYLRTKNNSYFGLLESSKTPNTEPFNKLNGFNIRAAHILHNQWFLFANQYYCRMYVIENDFTDLCQIKRVDQWVECGHEASNTITSDHFHTRLSNETLSNEDNRETSITVYGSDGFETTNSIEIESNSDSSPTTAITTIVMIVITIIAICAVITGAFTIVRKKSNMNGENKTKSRYLPNDPKRKSNKYTSSEKDFESIEGMPVTQKDSYAFVVSGKDITVPIHIEAPEQQTSNMSLFAPTELTVKPAKV